MKLKLFVVWIIFLTVGCVKQSEFTDDDDKLVVNPADIKVMNNLDVVPTKNGSESFFSKRINRHGLYVTYGITYEHRITKEKLRWTTSIQKFHKKESLNTLLNGSSVIKAIHKSYIVKLDLNKLGFDDGYCINGPDNFILQLKRDNMLYSIDAEGKWDLELKRVLKELDKHLDELVKRPL